MGRLELSAQEEKELVAFMERYLHELRVEIANTDDREFRRSLKSREAVIRSIYDRLRMMNL